MFEQQVPVLLFELVQDLEHDGSFYNEVEGVPDFRPTALTESS